MRAAQYTQGSLVARLDDQAERAITALEVAQRQRNEMRDERDAAIAANDRMLTEIEAIAYTADLTTDQLRAMARAAIAKATAA